MYLTKTVLNPEREGTRFLLSSPQRIHAAVMKSFSQNAIEEGTRPLWYLEQKRDPELYILGDRPADTQHIIEQAGRSNDPAISKSFENFLRNVQDGDRYLFKVQINPVIRSQKKNLPHVTEEQVISWFSKKAPEQWGFTTPHPVQVSHKNTTSFIKSNTRVTLKTALVRGQLIVSERDVFIKTFENGLGKAKAYGNGLLFLGKHNG